MAIAASGTVIAGGSLAGQVKPNPENGRIVEPLEFPAHLPSETFPQNIAEMIAHVDQEVRQFQDVMYNRPGSFSIVKQPPEIYFGTMSAMIDRTIRYLLGQILADPLYRVKPQDKDLETRLLNPALHDETVEYLLEQFIPRYFAYHGLLFEYALFSYGEVSFPVISFRKVEPPLPLKISLNIFFQTPISLRLYKTGPSLVRLPSAILGALANTPSFHTMPGTDQVFEAADQLEAEAKQQARAYLEAAQKYPGLLQGKPLTATEELNPILRAGIGLMIRGFLAYANGRNYLTDSPELQEIWRIFLNTMSLRHETVHVGDRRYIGHLKVNSPLQTLAELRGIVGGAVGMTGCAMTLGLLLQKSTTFSKGAMGIHGDDVLDLRDRIAWSVYNDAQLQQDLHVQVDRSSALKFADLPAETQSQVWDAVQLLNDEQASRLLGRAASTLTPLTALVHTLPDIVVEVFAGSIPVMAGIASGFQLYREYAQRRAARRNAKISYLATQVKDNLLVMRLYRARFNKKEFETALRSGRITKSYKALIEGMRKAADAAMGNPTQKTSKWNKILLWASLVVSLAILAAMVLDWMNIIQLSAIFPHGDADYSMTVSSPAGFFSAAALAPAPPKNHCNLNVGAAA